MKKVCVIGVGRVGLCLATVLANKGFNVIGIDTNRDLIEKLNKFVPSFYEKSLSGQLRKAILSGKLKFSLNYEEISDLDAVIITMYMGQNKKEHQKFLRVIEGLAKRLRRNQLVIIKSTVAVEMVEEIRNRIERSSGLEVEKNLFLAFVPERMVGGKAIEEITKLPKIIGVWGDESFKRTSEIFKAIGGDIVRVDPKTAVFIKLLDNAYRNTLFGLSNEFALIAEMHGIDVKRAIECASYMYPRNKIPTQGLVGGRCLFKDPHLMLRSEPDFPDLILTAKRLNTYIPYHIFKTILRIKRPRKVCILGLAYKKDVDDTRSSSSKVLVNLFRKEGIKVVFHDPFITATPVNNVLKGSDVVILATNHFEYKNVNQLIKGNYLFYDCWGMFDPSDFDKDVIYVGLGRTSS